MNQLQTFENELFKVSAKTEGEQILFDAEQVAKNLGFISKTTKNGIAYENVRWSRVNSFLPQVAELRAGDFIPEPLVYKLAFKAQNDVAEKFQDWLAIEVIPSIRRTGSYQAPKSELQVLQQTVNQLVTMDGRVTYLEDHMRINGLQEQRLQSKGKSKAVESLGGIDSPAYKQISRRVFSAIWRDFKNHFSIPRYNELPKKQFEDGMKFLNMWQPSTSLRIEIEELNNQQTMGVI